MEQLSASIKESLLDEDYCKIAMLDNGILYAKWNGFLTIDQIKNGCGVLTNYIKKNGLKIHLSDHSELKVLNDECKTYLSTEWFPEVEALGITKIAALISPNVFTRKSVDDVNESNNRVQMRNLTIENFNTQEDCEKWLLG
ncbi:hypothetical protein [Reichenbachiella versicolor]|uniref:hypothetical protein n=1 Tax=Reichenbachiella versicolor TaxID=1821036 RepID=UPI000D6E4D8D|nr:hypothetical protein [Reichenbachiella versicolor]